MNKHTPGPWETGTNELVWAGDICICEPIEGNVYANAKLIAVAPDLLAACEWLNKALYANGGAGWCAIRELPNAQQEVRKLAAAIKKAGG